jgi:hypothetical protein
MTIDSHNRHIYVTWAVNTAKKLLERTDNDVEKATLVLADVLEENLSQHKCTGFHAELLDDALSKIDWEEISASFIKAAMS